MFDGKPAGLMQVTLPAPASPASSLAHDARPRTPSHDRSTHHHLCDAAKGRDTRARLSPDRRPRPRRRSPNGGADRHRRVRRLVLRAAVRLAEHLRRPARPGTRRPFPDPPRLLHIHQQAALPSGHRRPDQSVHDRGRGRRDRRLHAGDRRDGRLRRTSTGPHGAVRPRHDDVPHRHRASLRLRPRDVRDPADRGRGGLPGVDHRADGQPDRRTGRRAAGHAPRGRAR